MKVWGNEGNEVTLTLEGRIKHDEDEISENDIEEDNDNGSGSMSDSEMSEADELSSHN